MAEVGERTSSLFRHAVQKAVISSRKGENDGGVGEDEGLITGKELTGIPRLLGVRISRASNPRIRSGSLSSSSCSSFRAGRFVRFMLAYTELRNITYIRYVGGWKGAIIPTAASSKRAK